MTGLKVKQELVTIDSLASEEWLPTKTPRLGMTEVLIISSRPSLCPLLDITIGLVKLGLPLPTTSRWRSIHLDRTSREIHNPSPHERDEPVSEPAGRSRAWVVPPVIRKLKWLTYNWAKISERGYHRMCICKSYQWHPSTFHPHQCSSHGLHVCQVGNALKKLLKQFKGNRFSLLLYVCKYLV